MVKSGKYGIEWGSRASPLWTGCTQGKGKPSVGTGNSSRSVRHDQNFCCVTQNVLIILLEISVTRVLKRCLFSRLAVFLLDIFKLNITNILRSFSFVVFAYDVIFRLNWPINLAADLPSFLSRRNTLVFKRPAQGEATHASDTWKRIESKALREPCDGGGVGAEEEEGGCPAHQHG